MANAPIKYKKRLKRLQARRDGYERMQFNRDTKMPPSCYTRPGSMNK